MRNAGRILAVIVIVRDHLKDISVDGRIMLN
jgi:hypothetical protein